MKINNINLNNKNISTNINFNNNPSNKDDLKSNSQRLGNIFFNKYSVCSLLKDDNISMFNDSLSDIYKKRVKQLIPLNL